MTTIQVGSHLHQHRYRIRGQLGKGGMGTVYLAEDLNLAGRLVAIKENLSSDEEGQRQFRREAVLLAHLRHPNLPQVIDYFLEPNGRQYLVMEYVPGENLQEVMRQQGPLSVNDALACIEQIMQAVAYMHNQRDLETGHRRAIVHRDIKPANIKRTPEGRFVLVDFGIAKQHSATLRATAVSARALTPGFAPIEQYGAGTDERSDIYSLGATLYALLTAKTPPSSVDLAAGAPLPPLRSYNSKIPADVAKAVERAMKVNAGDRFSRVDDMYTALTGRTLPTTPITGPVPPRPVASSRPDRRLAWIFGTLALLSVVGIWWLIASSEPQPEAGVPIVLAVTSTRTSPSPTAAGSIEPGQTGTPLPSGTSTRAPAATSTPFAAASEIPAVVSVSVIDVPEIGLLTPTPDATTVAAANATLTTFLASVGTSIAGVTPSPTSTQIPTRTPRPTSTPMPTSTPRPTNTPTATQAPPPVVAAPSIGSADGGPRSAAIIQPEDKHSSNTPTLFKWVADAPLAPGQEFEVIFWKASGETVEQGKGIVRSSTASEIMQPVDRWLAPDTYRWALILVAVEPTYTRLRTLAGPYEFTVPGGITDGGSGGGSGDGSGEK